MSQLLAPVFAGNDHLFVLIGGAGLIYVLWDAPDGVVMTFQARIRRFVARRRRGGAQLAAVAPAAELVSEPAGEPPAETATTIPGPASRRGAARASTTLRVDDVTVRYGGVTAVDSASFTVAPGEICGIIGPNGAGKTSLIDAITGFTAVASGSIRLGDRRIDDLPAHRRARLGLARSFQSLELFDDFTVRENLLTACDQWRSVRFATDPVVPSHGRLTPAGEAAVQQFGLSGLLDTRIRELPYGLRRLSAVARSVAAEPSVLLLDEPAAGLGDDESGELARHIRSLADDHGLAVVLIEHNLELVLDVSDQMMALDFGRTISTGSPSEVRNDPQVVAAYLGAEPEEPRSYETAIEGVQ
jgi:sulfate-transporting ATPase